MSWIRNGRMALCLLFVMVSFVPGAAAQTAGAPPYVPPRARPAVPAGPCGTPSALRILIAYSDVSEPTHLRTSLQQDAGVGSVDVLQIRSAAPTLAQMTPYDVVVIFSFAGLTDPVGTGDHLADSLDHLGVGVAFNNSGADTNSELIEGRWLSGGYSPYNGGSTHRFSDGVLGSYTAGHPLMTGVTSLKAYLRQTMTLSTGSTQVAAWDDGVPLIATKGRAVGVSAYVGDYYSGQASGDFDKIIVNAGDWLATCKTYSPLYLLN